MSSRIPLMAGNWKMNTTIPEAAALVDGMLNELPFIQGVEKSIRKDTLPQLLTFKGSFVWLAGQEV